MDIADFTKVSPVNTLQEEAVELITKLIIEGKLKQGERVNEMEVAALLNMSRGPIREGLQVLNQNGLVTHYPRRGMFVTKLEKEDVVEIYDIRFQLEKSAVELGFEQLTEEMIDKQRQIIAAMREVSQENRKDKLVLLDVDFHELIMWLPGYSRLVNTWKSYNSLINLIFAKVFELGTENEKEMADRHERLTNLLQERNKEKFLQELEEHYMAAKKALLNLWDKA